jgi:hypothetical protein
LPNIITDPPKYDFVFTVTDGGNSNLPISLKMNVNKEGVLKAQYIRSPKETYHYHQWKKLYIYEASTQKVRELPLPFPSDMEKIAEMREEVVESTQNLKLNTTLVSPDGYSLSYDGYSRSGLVGEIFMGGSYNSEPRLRKGSSSVRLVPGDNRTSFYYGSIEFIGWVTGAKK